MNTNLFFEGPVRSGKSTILRQALLPYLPLLGGFVVQRLLALDGAPIAYRLISLEEIKNRGEAGKVLFTAVDAPYPNGGLENNPDSVSDIFLWVSPRRMDLTVFETKGIACLHQSTLNQIILLDEIGGVDLLCTNFRDELFAVLKSSTPCIGIIKEKEKARDARSFNGDLRTLLSVQTLSSKIHSTVLAQVQSFLTQTDV
jgi:hypothetical protein